MLVREVARRDMKGPIIKGKRSVLVSWLFSYASVLLVPVLISAVIQVRTQAVFEREIRLANAAVFEQVRELMDSRLRDMERLGLQIAMNTRTQTLMYVKNELASYHHYTAAMLIQDLQLYRLANSFIRDFYVVFRNTNYAISPDTFCRTHMFFDVVHGDLGLSFEQWSSIMVAKHVREFLALPRVGEGASARRDIAYVQSLPMEDPARAVATLVIILDSRSMDEAIAGIGWLDRGTVMVIDSDNKVLVSSVPGESVAPIPYERLAGASGFRYEVINGKKVAVSYVTSSVGDMKFVSLLPAAALAEKSEHIRTMSLIGILLCLVTGGLVAYVLVKRNYHPIHVLIQSIRGRLDLLPETAGNEYERIGKAFTTALDEQNETRRILDEQKDQPRIIYLAGLLKRGVDEAENAEQALGALGVTFLSEYFAVAVIVLEEPDRRGSAGAPRRERHRAVGMLLENTLERLAGEAARFFLIPDLDGSACCLVNPIRGVGPEGDEYVRALMERLNRVLSADYGVVASIGLSRVHRGLTDVPKAYRQALWGVDDRVFAGAGRVIPFWEIESASAIQYNCCFSLDDEQELSRSLRIGDSGRAKAIAERVFSFIRSRKNPPPAVCRCLVLDVLSSVLKTLEKVDAGGGRELVNELMPLEAIPAAASIQDMQTGTMLFVEKACRLIESRKKSHNVRLRDGIIRHIEDNYADANLCVSQIAECFHVSLTYVSKFFKEQTGEGLLDAINRTKLRKAKELLERPGSSIGEVARQVGLHNANTLIRIFKKYEGITPGKYKEAVLGR